MRTHFSSLDIWDEKYDILGAPELNGLSLNLVAQEVLFFKRCLIATTG
jgi:hypothetical protein